MTTKQSADLTPAAEPNAGQGPQNLEGGDEPMIDAAKRPQLTAPANGTTPEAGAQVTDADSWAAEMAWLDERIPTHAVDGRNALDGIQALKDRFAAHRHASVADLAAKLSGTTSALIQANANLQAAEETVKERDEQIALLDAQRGLSMDATDKLRADHRNQLAERDEEIRRLREDKARLDFLQVGYSSISPLENGRITRNGIDAAMARAALQPPTKEGQP